MKRLVQFAVSLWVAAGSLSGAESVIISEFMASNTRTLADEDGSYEDWIEINNTGDAVMNLGGWCLTDDAGNLTRWQFPATNIGPGRFMIVFASGKDRRIPGTNLHTNFKLSAGGEYLALVKPDGAAITTQFSPAFPPQVPDVSFGCRLEATNILLVSTSAAVRVLVPSANITDQSWTLPGFDDLGWMTGTNGVGYEAGLFDPVEDGYAGAVSEAAPIAWWRFDEATGTVAANSGSLGAVVNGSCVGGVVAGQAGARPSPFPGFETNNLAKSFDGATGRVRVPDNAAFDFGSGAFSIVIWFNPANPAVRGDLFTYKGAAGDFGIHVASVSANTISVFLNSFIGTGGPLAANQWHCFALARDATGACAGYLNGVAIVTGNNASTMSIAADLLIGSNHTGDPSTPSIPFNGLIDEVAIYNRALSAAEAGLQYQKALGTLPAGPSIATDVLSAMYNVNSSALIRIPFLVTNLSGFSRLTLRMKYDDGFVAYVNGQEAMAANAPLSNTWSSAATHRHPDAQAAVFEDFDISDQRGALVQGTNVLAIQGLNYSPSNADFLIVAELVATSVGAYDSSLRYFTRPTPGSPNGAGTADLGPVIAGVGFTPVPPRKPLDGDSITVTARVAQAFSPVTNITLRYRVMFGPTNELAMADDGAHGDGAVGDGIYGGVIPASASGPGQMVRFLVAARDAQGRESRWPLFEDPLNSPRYLGTVIADPTIASNLPVWEWFTDDLSGSRSRGGARGAVWYNGRFYDNIFVRQRGGFINLNSQKFDFNTGDHCWIEEEIGAVEEANLNAEGSDPSYIRQALAYETYRRAGHEASGSFHVLMRVNAGPDRVGIFVEQVDERFLDRYGLDRAGALYKFVQRASGTPVFSDATDGVEKKTRLTEDNSDLQAFVNGLNQATAPARRAWFFDNLNVPQWLNFLALRSITQDADDIRKNFYLYRDTLGNREWSIFPWDKDWTFGVTGDGGAVLPHPFFGDFAHRKSGDQWNKLYEFVFNDPVLQPLYLRRLRTLMDRWLQPPALPAGSRYFEQRAIDWMRPVGMLLGSGVSNQLTSVQGFFVQRRTDLYVTYAATNTGAGPANALVPLPAPTNAALALFSLDFNPASGNQAEEFICLTNPSGQILDISGWQVDGAVKFTFKPGTVVSSNGVIYVSPDVAAFRARSASPKGGQGLFVVGPYKGQLSARGETIRLYDDSGRGVFTNTYVGAPSLAQQYLRITEIMYNPAPLAGNTNNAQEFEYLELKNLSGSITLDLRGVGFSNGLDFSFNGSAITNLAPGASVLIVKNTNAFVARYGTGLPIAGSYLGNLDNAGERLVLLDASNEQILDFSYDNKWYPLTDGVGFSLVVVSELAEPDAWNLKENWRASGRESGSPGGADPAPVSLAPVWVNEARTRADNPPGLDMIELHNPNAAAVDIGGWYLTDDFHTPRKYQIPIGTVVGSGCYVTFDETQYDPVPPQPAGFGLGSDGDELYLFGAVPGGGLSGYVHGFQFGGSDDWVSFGRHVSSDGREHFVAQVANSLGTNNVGPRVGPVVISELMYHPPDVGGVDNTVDEFIELRNITGVEVRLYDEQAPTNAWRVRGEWTMILRPIWCWGRGSICCW